MMKLVNHFLKYLKLKYMNIIRMDEFGSTFGSYDWKKIWIPSKFGSFGDSNLDQWLENTYLGLYLLGYMSLGYMLW